MRFDSQPINVRLDDLEDRSRRNNLRFEGISESYRENWEQTADHVGRLVREKLGVEGDVAIQRAHRVGDPNSGRPRTIIANFLRFRDRQEILRNRHKLKNTDIYVNEDLCSASLAKRRQQLPELQRARREGKTAFFVHTKLVIKERVTADRGTPNALKLTSRCHRRLDSSVTHVKALYGLEHRPVKRSHSTRTSSSIHRSIPYNVHTSTHISNVTSNTAWLFQHVDKRLIFSHRTATSDALPLITRCNFKYFVSSNTLPLAT